MQSKIFFLSITTVDPWLPRPQVSGHSDYPELVVTVQLEYFIKIVHLLECLNGVLYINRHSSIILFSIM